MKVLLNDTTEVLGIYDSGSNVSLINSKLLNIRKKRTENTRSVGLTTINSVKNAEGMINLKMKIFEREKNMNVFVDKKSFKYDFLIRLNCIKKFQLIQNEKLEITQKYKIQKNESRVNRNTKKREIIDECQVNYNEHIDIKKFHILIT